MDAVFKVGAAQGLGFHAASGDSGSDDAGDGGTSVDYPASDPYVTGVGGTKLTVTSSNAFSKEVAWSGGGGGSNRPPTAGFTARAGQGWSSVCACASAPPADRRDTW